MRRAPLLLVALAFAACEQAPPPAAPTPVAEAAPAPPVAEAPASPAVVEALPREIAGVALGANFAAAQRALGALDCHDNAAGFRVCAPQVPPAAAPNKFEIYLVHDEIISLSYERDVGGNVWDFLHDLMTRYGKPSLNGNSERDAKGRTHEIYGWKDDRSIYSVRFVWQGESADARQLATTAITLWDRQAFQQWEAEAKHPTPAKPVAPAVPTEPAVGEPA